MSCTGKGWADGHDIVGLQETRLRPETASRCQFFAHKHEIHNCRDDGQAGVYLGIDRSFLSEIHLAHGHFLSLSREELLRYSTQSLTTDQNIQDLFVGL